jgi:prepilin-type N-terminal cleavage/methylation domain-containing protein/prepilin-type processing-associated H-X9-DG protein
MTGILLRRRLRAFSLVELLVVITIIGVLLALLLPAVQAAREAARKISCSNNFRQIGIGLQHYHEVHGLFPPGGIEVRTVINPETHKVYGKTGRQFGWSALLLPFVEQQSVYDRIDFNKKFDDTANDKPAAALLSVYICPSVPDGNVLCDGRGPSYYGGIQGERITTSVNATSGVMLYTRSICIAEIIDGAANTLIVSEDSVPAADFGQWINGNNVYDVSCAVNHAPALENDIKSYHPGGANGAFCDGSVRFLTESMDINVLAAICTRDGRELFSWP